MKHHRLSEALLNLRPGAQFSITDDNFARVEVYDATVLPSVDEMQAELDRLDVEFVGTAYRRARAEAYASWGDQLDMQFHDLVDGTTTWRDHVAAVKAAHPKPD
jgi:hypothetical protein